MPKLRRVSGEEAIRALERLGFRRVRQRGSHVTLIIGERVTGRSGLQVSAVAPAFCRYPSRLEGGVRRKRESTAHIPSFLGQPLPARERLDERGHPLNTPAG